MTATPAQMEERVLQISMIHQNSPVSVPLDLMDLHVKVTRIKALVIKGQYGAIITENYSGNRRTITESS